MNRQWTDQPEILETAEVLCTFTIGSGVIAEVRRSTSLWYLTTGNLFGSQTIQSQSPEGVFRAIDAAYRVRDNDRARQEGIKLPSGCELVSGGST